MKESKDLIEPCSSVVQKSEEAVLKSNFKDEEVNTIDPSVNETEILVGKVRSECELTENGRTIIVESVGNESVHYNRKNVKLTENGVQIQLKNVKREIQTKPLAESINSDTITLRLQPYTKEKESIYEMKPLPPTATSIKAFKRLLVERPSLLKQVKYKSSFRVDSMASFNCWNNICDSSSTKI